MLTTEKTQPTAYVIRDGDEIVGYQYWTAIVGKSPAVCKMWTGDIALAKRYATRERAALAMKCSRIGEREIVGI